MTAPPPDPLFTVRAALILLLAALIGLAAGVLSYLAGQPVAQALLVGGGAAGAVLVGGPKLIK